VIGRFVIGLTGLVVVAYAGALVWMSELLQSAPASDSAPGDLVVLFVCGTLAVSLLYLGSCIAAHRAPPPLAFILFIGVMARMILVLGAPGPVLEGDHERIRFDARMVNRGADPYALVPGDLADEVAPGRKLSAAEAEHVAQVRASLSASETSPRPEGVQRPDLRPTRSPAALGIAALGDRFKPANTRGYAFLVLCADALACFLILLALRSLEFPLAWVIVYAWSPILLKEAYCTLAVDAFVLPAIAGLVYGLVAGRRVFSAMAMGAMFALRPAFLILSPVLARRAGVVAVLLGLVLAALTVVPVLRSPDGSIESVAQAPLHVWRHFEYNSLVESGLRTSFAGVDWKAESSLTLAGVPIIEPDEPLAPLLAKVFCLALLLGVVTFLVIRVSDRVEEAKRPGLNDLFVGLAALLLLSPVLKPQHTIWLLPILAVRVYGVAWLALPFLTTISYLTHLGGPLAADIALPGTSISFRVVEFGLFGLLLILDRYWMKSLFPDATAYDEHIVWRVEESLHDDDPAPDPHDPLPA